MHVLNYALLVALSFVIAFVHTRLFPGAPCRMSINDLNAAIDKWLEIPMVSKTRSYQKNN